MKSRAICVLGMHRSGTSTVARMINLLGVYLGEEIDIASPTSKNIKEFQKRHPDNPTGFWEHRAIIDFHDRLLDRLESRWDATVPLSESWHLSEEVMPFRAELVDLVSKHFSGHKLWAWKDPRSNILLKLWKDVLGEFGIELSCVFAVRNPLDVARSLNKRDGFPLDKGYGIWINYLMTALQETVDMPTAFVLYDNVLVDWEKELRKCSRKLQIGWPKSDRVLRAKMHSFVRNDLCHSASGINDLYDNNAPYPVIELYKEILNSLDNLSMTKDAVIKLSKEFLTYSRFFHFDIKASFNLQKTVPNLKEAVKEKEDHLVALNASVMEKEACIEGLESSIDERDSQIESLKKSAREMDGHLVALNASVMEKEVCIEGLESSIDERDSQIESLKKSAREMEDHLVALNASIMEKEACIEGLESSIGERDSQIESLKEAVRKKDDYLVALDASVMEKKAYIEGLESSIGERDSQIGSLNETVREKDILLAHIYNSHGWKALLLYYKSRDLVLPVGSRWRKTVKFFFLLPNMITGLNIKKSIWYFKKHGLKNFIGKAREKVKKKITGEAEMRGPAMMARSPLTVDLHATQAEVSSLIEAITNVKREQYDILVFPVIDWYFRIQRPQHLAREMGKLGYRVIYLSTTFYESDNPTFRIMESPEENVFIVQLGFPGPHPRIYIDRPEEQHLQYLSGALLDLYSRCGIKAAIGIVNLPFWRGVVESLPATLLVYDCMDYHAGFSTNSDAMLGEEELLLKSADLVITASAKLSKMVANEADNVLIRNAGEIDFFAKQPESLKIGTHRPVVGYYGAIAEWFDLDLVIKAARHYPEWNFVLVGAVTDQDTEEAASLPNVRFTGEVPYKDLPGYLYAFDVCMIPFKICELTLCTNPVKVYEYCAAGKPVVSSSMPELMEIDDIVYVADGCIEFIEKLALAMKEVREEKNGPLATRRAQWARQNDWHERSSLLHETIKSAFPKVSVIVLTYNNLGFTQACLSSLERHTHYLNWELIMVDNASTDGTSAYLKDYAARHNHVKIVLNEKNLGFSAGNNVGLREAEGEYLVILNNDTYVTDGWMLGLIRHLRKRPDIGLIGPVTNNIGNEARIEIHYANMEEMSEQAQRYTSAHPRESFYNNTLGFFCVAMSHKVYEKVGPMDEAFGLGFFEDDDYCRRVHEAGFKVAVSEDVFVHHHLSGSFDLLNDGERQRLFEKNKKIYEEKWGTWVPHKYREEEWSQRNALSPKTPLQ